MDGHLRGAELMNAPRSPWPQRLGELIADEEGPKTLAKTAPV
jgi:hypothetical protein